MPKNVTFRESAVVLLQKKQSAINNIKSYIGKKVGIKDKKNSVQVHPLIEKSSL